MTESFDRLKKISDETPDVVMFEFLADNPEILNKLCKKPKRIKSLEPFVQMQALDSAGVLELGSFSFAYDGKKYQLEYPFMVQYFLYMLGLKEGLKGKKLIQKINKESVETWQDCIKYRATLMKSKTVQ